MTCVGDMNSNIVNNIILVFLPDLSPDRAVRSDDVDVDHVEDLVELFGA